MGPPPLQPLGPPPYEFDQSSSFLGQPLPHLSLPNVSSTLSREESEDAVKKAVGKVTRSSKGKKKFSFIRMLETEDEEELGMTDTEGEEELRNFEGACDLESDNSIECDDLVEEELRYDDAELLEIRGANLNLRKVQKNRVGPFTNNDTGVMPNPSPMTSNEQVVSNNATLYEQTVQQEGETLSSNWPSYWTTYEGGYESDQRDSDDESSVRDSEDEFDEYIAKGMRVKKNVDYPFFNEKTDMKNVHFEEGMRFPSQKVLKEAILWYSIQDKKDIIYLKNDKIRIHIGCAGCKWEMTVGPDLKHLGGWQIKKFYPKHRCVRTFSNRLITCNWLANMYLDKILRNPKMLPAEIKDDMKTRFDTVVNLRKCSRAKDKALNAVLNLMKRQYGVLKPYMMELCKSNPGTTCVLKAIDSPIGQPAIFQRFYICFDALKRAFNETCRPIIGVDGCFLKHACGGQLLCAVGRDGNNHMFPIAWAVVETESRSSWEWFLRLVTEDLKMQDGEGWTIISDQQKGLVPAIHEIWPKIEHRQCARHIYSNWNKVHKGKQLQLQFWKCVKATSMGEYATEILNMKMLSQQAHDDFLARDPNTFCKSHFKIRSSCDVVDNNMAETFNSFILLARYKPIVSMFEDIRLALMDRMRKKKEEVCRFVVGVAPRISEKLEGAYEEQKRCECRWNGGDSQSGFEVLHNGVSHAVDLDKRTCSCRVWDLTGVPCPHAMSAILYMNKGLNDYLAKWYKEDTYSQTYTFLLQPVKGCTFWDQEGNGMILPPNIVRKQPGRRKTRRRRDADEPKKKTKYSRKGLPTKCSNCGNTDHDKRKCTNPPLVRPTRQEGNETNSQATRRGRPKGSKCRIGREDGITPAQYLATLRKHRAKTSDQSSIPNTFNSQQQSRDWLSSVEQNSSMRGGRGRYKGKGRGNSGGPSRGRGISSSGGIGLFYGEGGEVAFRSSLASPGIVIRDADNQP